jgi:multicomponent Na+:H+ antiporter subunit E
VKDGNTNAAKPIALAILRRTALLALIWAALVGPDVEGWLFGAAAIPAAVWLSLSLLRPRRALHLGQFLAMVPGFLIRSVAGGLDVAWRAFNPRMPLRPGWLIRPVTLTAGGRVALGAELSLMPGTLVAGSDGDNLLVHVLNTGDDHHDALALEEARLAAIMGRHE